MLAGRQVGMTLGGEYRRGDLLLGRAVWGCR